MASGSILKRQQKYRCVTGARNCTPCRNEYSKYYLREKRARIKELV